jgi:hypothetical protein
MLLHTVCVACNRTPTCIHHPSCYPLRALHFSTSPSTPFSQKRYWTGNNAPTLGFLTSFLSTSYTFLSVRQIRSNTSGRYGEEHRNSLILPSPAFYVRTSSLLSPYFLLPVCIHRNTLTWSPVTSWLGDCNNDTRCCMHLSQTNLQLQANHWLQSSTEYMS